MKKYWIGVACREHVGRGRELGICQMCHGKAAPLRRMHQGDGLIYYSGKEQMDKPALCQRFTSIGYVAGDDVRQVEMGADWTPWQRRINYIESQEAHIRPLIESLEFIRDKSHWGAPFRFGFLEIGEADFLRIAEAMDARPRLDEV